MVLRRLPRHLRSSALSLPLVLTLGCSSSPGTGSGPERSSTTWRDPIGHCFVSETVRCPPNATCNPPPPRRIACPDGGVGLDLDNFEGGVGRLEDGRCVTILPPTCPVETTVCTENLGEAVPCPEPGDKGKALRFDRFVPKKTELLRPAGRILRRADGTCTLLAEPPRCPPNATCNPPPPRPIECPADPKEIHFDQMKPPTPAAP